MRICEGCKKEKKENEFYYSWCHWCIECTRYYKSTKEGKLISDKRLTEEERKKEREKWKIAESLYYYDEEKDALINKITGREVIVDKITGEWDEY